MTIPFKSGNEQRTLSISPEPDYFPYILRELSAGGQTKNGRSKPIDDTKTMYVAQYGGRGSEQGVPKGGARITAKRMCIEASRFEFAMSASDKTCEERTVGLVQKRSAEMIAPRDSHKRRTGSHTRFAHTGCFDYVKFASMHQIFLALRD